MAAYNKFDIFLLDLCNGEHKLNAAAHILKIYLSNTLPVVTNTLKANIAEIAQSGSGYTAGGQDIQNDSANSPAGTCTVTAVDVTWTATAAWTGNPFQYVILYNSQATSKTNPLICWWAHTASITMGINDTFTADFGTELFHIT